MRTVGLIEKPKAEEKPKPKQEPKPVEAPKLENGDKPKPTK